MPQLYREFKKIFFIFFILVTASNSNAQELRPFVGAGFLFQLYSFEKDLETSPAISFSAGSEYRATDFLIPEIEVNYMFGNLKDNPGSNTSITSEKSFSNFNFSFCSKIVLGDYHDSGYIQILPKYIYSLIDVTETKGNNALGSVQTKRSLSASQHNFGLGLGYVFNFDSWYSNSMAINLYYNTIRVSDVFNQLNPGTEKADNVGVFGLGFNYYFGVKRIK
ncbi:hypothetical protein IRZ71_18925 [Flavobacterium sp. ANB]|uniref:hypothetical protein n=1 Tax=unclassified Flavobacterium TaxID=196869 RepID=UPI0012B9054D|nr:MULTISPECIES: hypothetical protein [unclassified Flavobacterium]MBF4518434.1 hypothetical protein [Flavobacterium sp. ANB]MTD70872.1 hypothetical protein [Flavobacterium sp. LC2016-13]